MKSAVAAALAAALLAAPTAAAEHRTLELLSAAVPVSGVEGYTEVHHVSDDGSRVIVQTDEALALGDTDRSTDVYERTPAGAFVLLSDGAFGVDAEEESHFAEASDDGRFVAFTAVERLTATDTDSEVDVYAHSAGVLVHLSDDPTGADDEDPAQFVAISRDGASLIFETRERLAPTDDDDEVDVYRRVLAGGLIHVSDDPTGPELNNPAHAGAASESHDRVFFRTAESLADTDSDNAQDVYELGPAGLRHLTDDPTGPDAMTDAAIAGNTPDGSHVYFQTRESLAAGDEDTGTDVYERTSAGLRHVSDDPTGPDDPLDATFLHASPDGSRVRFATRESLAASDMDARADLYELAADGTLVHVSGNPLGPDGDFDVELQGASGDGTRVYFQTAERLAASDTDGSRDAYEHGPGGLRHITDGPGPDAETDGSFNHASYDGRRVLFETHESMAPGDTDSDNDVYERTPSGALIVVSDGDNGPDADRNAHVGAVSADGTRVYLDAFDPLLPADTNDYRDVYLSTLVPDPPPPAGEPPTGTPRDTTPPRISRVRVVRGRLRFTLSERADVRIAVRGRRTLRLAGLAAGAHRVKLRVRRGRHRATITAVDAAGNRSTARLRFRIRR